MNHVDEQRHLGRNARQCRLPAALLALAILPFAAALHKAEAADAATIGNDATAMHRGADAVPRGSVVPQGSVPVDHPAATAGTVPDRVAAAGEVAGTPSARRDPVSVILARPLFDPSRHPDAQAQAPDSMPKLTGIVSHADLTVAIFRASGMDHAQVLKLGGIISGWSLVAITADSATLTRNGKTVTLQPDFRKQASMP